MANTLMPFDEVAKALADDFNRKVVAPMVDAGRAAGMTDEQINLEINRALFDEFSGLHGFPPSHRP